jgi:hypothetical protein
MGPLELALIRVSLPQRVNIEKIQDGRLDICL